VRLAVEGRSTAQGKSPAWLERAATFVLVGVREGSTVLVIEAPSLAEAAPERFGQVNLFGIFDPGRSCLDLLEQGLRDAISSRAESDAYDDGLVKTFEEFSRVLRHGVDAVEFGHREPVRVDGRSVEALARLRRAIPPDQTIRLAGKLDVLRHSDRMFTLILETGAHVRGVVASEEIDLSALGDWWGQDVVVTGVAKFRPSGSVLRVEAERIERAGARDLSLWGDEPRPVLDDLDQQTLRQPQGPRSGVNAVFGRLDGVESDADIIEALEQLS